MLECCSRCVDLLLLGYSLLANLFAASNSRLLSLPLSNSVSLVHPLGCQLQPTVLAQTLVWVPLSLSRSRSLTRTLAELKTTHSEHTFQCCCLFSVHSLRSWSCLIQFYSKRNLRSFTRLLLATNRWQQKLLADNREESQSSSSELHSFASSISAFNLALCLLFGAGKL